MLNLCCIREPRELQPNGAEDVRRSSEPATNSKVQQPSVQVTTGDHGDNISLAKKGGPPHLMRSSSLPVSSSIPAGYKQAQRAVSSKDGFSSVRPSFEFVNSPSYDELDGLGKRMRVMEHTMRALSFRMPQTEE